MMRRLSSALLLALGGFLLASAASAGAITPGTMCVPDPATAKVSYTAQWGIQNDSTTSSASVLCPGPAYQPAQVRDVAITVYDSTTATNDLCCTANVVDKGGTILQSNRVCAPGFGGQAQVLRPNITGMIGALVLSCTIPKTDPQNGPSYVTSYDYTPGGDSFGGDVHLTPGTVCVPAASQHRTDLQYSQWGIQNNSGAGPIEVVCPGASVNGTNITSPMFATVYDRTMATNDLCCTAEAVNWNGRVVSSVRGCAPTWGGLSQDIPFDMDAAGIMVLDCNIPAHDAANGYSHVSSFTYGNYQP